MHQVSWDEAQAASQRLLDGARPFSQQLYESFGWQSGVYVFVYNGSQLGGSLWGEPQPRIVYLGHNGEDSKRHWQNDTGVSTARRSLAALLATSLNLHPVPNPRAEGEDRFYNYQLDETGELILTNWMQENIQLSFLDLPADEVEAWYHALLEFNAPMLVLRNNPNNSYSPQIKLYRSQLAEQAAQL